MPPLLLWLLLFNFIIFSEGDFKEEEPLHVDAKFQTWKPTLLTRASEVHTV